MDEKTLQALTDLAEKLGTTSEYLWGALIKQAPITGAVDLMIMVAWVAAAAGWFALVKRKTTEPPKSDEDRYPRAEWVEESAFIGWVSVAIFSLIAGVVVSSTLSITIAALLNPEYWALAQILK